MTRAQEHLLMLFKEIVEICHKHDLVYYMAGGTLIGAIRHKGFIPWDDDMDILMTRDTWHKFIEISKTELPPNRVLECQELNRDFPNMVGRYTDTTSAAIHRNQVLGDGIAGQVIDILVLDPIPDKEESYRKYHEDLMLYSDLINPSLNYSYRWGINEERYKQYYARMKKEGKDKVLSELEQRMFCYKEEECDYYVMRWGGAAFIFDKDMYGSSRWADFEDTKCRVPDRTGDYLTWHYGDDWMYIPPHAEQETHNAIFSFTTDYKTIQNDYMRYLDVPGIRKSFVDKKLYIMKQMKKKMAVNVDKIEMTAVAQELTLAQKVRNFDGDLETLLKEEKYDELAEFFDEYYGVQGSRRLIGREDYKGIYRFHNPVYIEIDDDIFYIAVMALIHTNKLAKAARFIDVYEHAKGKLTDKIASARELIKVIREPISDYDLGRREMAFEKVETLYAKYPKNKTLILFKVRMLVQRKAYKEAEALIEKAIALFPDDGYFRKYLGDVYYEAYQDIEKAYQEYHFAVGTTNNGIVLLEIQERAEKDKFYFMDKARREQNIELCDMLLDMIPKDMDVIACRYEILLGACVTMEEKDELLESAKEELYHFEYDRSFEGIFSKIYQALGESESIVSLRTKILFARTVEDYKECEEALLQAENQNPEDGTVLKLLGDVYNWLGKKKDAKKAYVMAKSKTCSVFAHYELNKGEE